MCVTPGGMGCQKGGGALQPLVANGVQQAVDGRSTCPAEVSTPGMPMHVSGTCDV
jgi:hypothetical protein